LINSLTMRSFPPEEYLTIAFAAAEWRSRCGTVQVMDVSNAKMGMEEGGEGYVH